jgi:acyl-[acyl-carrier-protein]-phospholipid O-acyltransferase/long-chain-fatty-acid--[acyl-carrier-protein] ligase
MTGAALAGSRRYPPGLAGVRALLGVQCFGAFNGNLYKTVVSLMAADLALVGQGGAALLSLSSIVFVAPYILFSGYAGYVADRFDKRSVVIAAKLGETLVMGMAFVALTVGRIELLVVILFLLSIQATFFSPAKYGILPEALASSRLSRANGLMEMTRYLAVILGTASAGLLLSVWHRHPARIGVVLIGVAAAGLLVSLAIGPVPRPVAAKAFHVNPWREIADGMRRLAVDRSLALAVAGIAWFEFLCALVMLNMILLGKTQMGLDDLHIGVLGAVVGIGAGAGSLMTGYLSGGRVEPGLALVGYVGIGAMLLGLVPATAAYATTATAFLVLGLFAGMVVVPLNALLQRASGADEKGRLIATSNLLGMSGVVAGSASLWLLHDLGGIAPDRILILAAALALSAVLWAALRQPAWTTRAVLRLLASIRRG